MTALAVLGVVIVVVVLAVMALVRDDAPPGQVSDVSGQGGEASVLAGDGARLERQSDGLDVVIDVPTPTPGTYEYPSGEMVPPWADPHPRVSPGAGDAPEVFTVWLVAFNVPEQCTDGACDVDDIGAEAPARGGMYLLDGRIGDDDRLTFIGHIRLGEGPLDGAPLEDPLGAEVHVAIAPHGRLLPGVDGWRQLNGPVGNPMFWWSAEFES